MNFRSLLNNRAGDPSLQLNPADDGTLAITQDQDLSARLVAYQKLISSFHSMKRGLMLNRAR